MINNLFHSEPDVVKYFHESEEHTFYISTLNFWKHHYFVKASPKAEQFLYNLGFDLIPGEERKYFFDDDSELVLKLKLSGGKEIIVSLSANPKLRNEIQILINKLFPAGLYGSFEEKKKILNELFHFCYETSNLTQSTRIV